MNTWRRNPGQTKHDPDEAITWISPNGKTLRQIDYILINQKYRNWVRRVFAEHSWRGNMEQNRQHSAIIMKIQVRHKHNYFTKPPKKTGTEIQYDIKHATKQPELLEQHFTNSQIHIEYENAKTTAENWGRAKQIIHGSLKQVFPVKEKKQPKANMAI